MKNVAYRPWLSPLIETEKYKNVSIIGNSDENEIKILSDTIFNIEGNLITISDNTVKINNSIEYDNVNSVFPILQLKKLKLDMLIIDEYIDNIYELINSMKNNGIILINKCIKDSKLKKLNNLINQIFETKDYNFYITKENNDSVYYKEIKTRITSIENNLETKEINKIPIIGVGVLTYNHEKYIKECLFGVFKQKGNFKIKLTIIDDCSTDNTAQIIEEFLKDNKIKNIQVKFIRNSKNIGMVKNMKVLMNAFNNTDYFTFCEGDDFWISDLRINKFINYMKNNPFVSVAFNNLYIYNETDYFKKYDIHALLNQQFYNSRELINNENFIGNFSCCFYDSSYLDKIEDRFYDLTLYDFFFNTIYSNYGFIGNLGEYLSIYRYHSNSIWSSKKNIEKRMNMYKYINDYNKSLNFVYDLEYRNYHNLLLSNEIPTNYIKKDIMIIDNVFPSELSQFSYQEITSYLNYFKSIICISTGLFLPCFKDSNHDRDIQKYKINNPELYDKITDYTDIKPWLFNPKLLYFIFFQSVKIHWDFIKKKKTPFVFELYPGGGFSFDDPECDLMLKKIMSSKYFKKVIVTQNVVRDYLLKKKLCKKSQIELIFGVVMPLNCLEKEYKFKYNYGINKKQLDIVFMAHKYTKRGVDKGYDTYIEVAKKLTSMYRNVYFHVVGGFTEEDIDVSNISDRIKFYGNLPGSELDEFFVDKDIILSPNIPNKIFQGSFDGFPTASCTEAGLRKTAMFCTDPLLMNNDKFKNNEEIVLIKPEVDDIVNKIKYYYDNPNKLKDIGEKGSAAIKKIYDYEHQIKPRINILNKVLGRNDKYEETKN